MINRIVVRRIGLGVLLHAATLGSAMGFQAEPPGSNESMCAAAAGLPSGHDNLVDINSAPAGWLVELGMEPSAADHLVAGRPYRNSSDLVDRGVISKATFERIKGRLIARGA